MGDPTIQVRLSGQSLPHPLPLGSGGAGAVVEFRGVVRPLENGRPIAGLRYEAYESMAAGEMLRILGELKSRHGIREAHVWHRTGFVAAGEAAVSIAIASAHRGEAFAAMVEFLDRLKQDVPIWKTEAVPC